MNFSCVIRSAFLLLLFFVQRGPLTAQIEDAFQISNLYQKGVYEVHLFNNYFTRSYKTNGSQEFNNRENFFTITGQFTYGISNRVNVGMDFRLRSVTRLEGEEGDMLEALNFKNIGRFNQNGVSGYQRAALSLIGPRIKYQPFTNFTNFSIQHTALVPVESNLNGDQLTGFLDWETGMFFTQFFLDQPLTRRFFLFTEIDIIIENVGTFLTQPEDINGYYQLGFPFSLIGTYLINKKNYLYGMINAASLWAHDFEPTVNDYQTSFIPYSQLGIGYKYFPVPWLQFEALITKFFDGVPNSNTSTFNIGIRVFGRRGETK